MSMVRYLPGGSSTVYVPVFWSNFAEYDLALWSSSFFTSGTNDNVTYVSSLTTIGAPFLSSLPLTLTMLGEQPAKARVRRASPRHVRRRTGIMGEPCRLE